MQAMIEAENLGRYFGEIKAVDGVSFSASKGDVLGFLGPNGAGKSTTMKILTCFLTPNFGTASILGFSIKNQAREVRQSLGYLPENAPLYSEMSVREFLKFVTEVRGIKEAEKAISRVLELATLHDVANQRIETLSKGFKRRVGLAQALIHDPQILILDEPTDGLDPNQKHDVRQLIRQMAAEKCIILSTHILEEVEEVCNRAIVIAKGKIVANDTPRNLKKRSKSYGAVVIGFKEGVPERAEAVLSALPEVASLEQSMKIPGENKFMLLPKPNTELLKAVMNVADKEKWQFSDIVVEDGHLDEVFREITA